MLSERMEVKKMSTRRMILSVGFVIWAFLSGLSAADEAKTYKIGVLAKRGTERCLAKWTATAHYLTEAINSAGFEIVPLAFDQIYPTVEAGEVDFVVTNSSFYVHLEAKYGVSRMAPYVDVWQGEWFHILTESGEEFIINPDKVLYVKAWGIKK